MPVALARFLHGNGRESIRVQNVGLEAADDRSIWQYALARNLTIVTKDEDFRRLPSREAAFGCHRRSSCCSRGGSLVEFFGPCGSIPIRLSCLLLA
jgi:hypothetical protein